MKKEKKIEATEKVMFDLYSDYLKFKSVVKFIKEKNEKELTEEYENSLRDELEVLSKEKKEFIKKELELRKTKVEPMKEDVVRFAEVENEIGLLEAQIEYCTKTKKAFESAKSKYNEIVCHYNNLKELLSSDTFVDEELKEIK